MIFDELMEFIEGDEEMGEIEQYGHDGFIDIRISEGKKILNIHFYACFDDEYDMIKEVLNVNGVKYYHSNDLELKSEKMTVDEDSTCVFSIDSGPCDESEFIASKGKYIELVDAWAHLQIKRKDGKKKLETTFFIGVNEHTILTSFLNCHNVAVTEFYDDECIGTMLQVQLDVRVHFLPKKLNNKS